MTLRHIVENINLGRDLLLAVRKVKTVHVALSPFSVKGNLYLIGDITSMQCYYIKIKDRTGSKLHFKGSIVLRLVMLILHHNHIQDCTFRKIYIHSLIRYKILHRQGM